MNHNPLHLTIRLRYLALGGLLLLLAAGLFWVWRGRQAPATGSQTIPRSEDSGEDTPTTGLQTGGNPLMQSGKISPVSIHLSEGQAQPQTAQPLPVATGEPLSPDEVAQILARLPELPPLPGDQVDFRLAQEPIPPPKTGETIQQDFPPQPTSIPQESVEAGPLKVLRFSPEGEIPVAPFVSVTFNQPMIALDTLNSLSAGQVPVQIEPSLPGTWRWLGARTLTFEYDSAQIDRLPKATAYQVRVPAGTASATGGVLAEDVTWTFSTPPPQVVFSLPSDTPQPNDPLFFIAFDQRIDPAAVLETVRVTAGGRMAALRLANPAELQADEQNAKLIERAGEGRWLAFRAAEPLPLDSQVEVNIGPETPSDEGPLRTQEVQTYRFRTYAPLRIEDHGCYDGTNSCSPLAPFFIRFNNPIDSDAYTDSMLTIQPELPGASVDIFGETLQIRGATQGQTTYTVVVGADLRDAFGQTLGQPVRLTFKVGPADALLSGPGPNFITLDPASKHPVFSVYVINYNKLDVQIYAVQPSDWPAYLLYLQKYQRTDQTGAPPGQLILNKSLPVEAAADKLTEVNIDLAQVLDGKFGQFVVIVSPPKGFLQRNKYPYWQTVQAWVQVTQIGLDAYTDQSEMVVWTTQLTDGKPLAGIEVNAGSTLVGTTREDGTARFPIPDGAAYLVARQGADQAILPRSTNFWDNVAWKRSLISDELRWYVFDDRQMYRPGEEVHIKGWLRRIGGKQDGDVGLVGSAIPSITYQITGPQGNDLGSGQAAVNALGGFDFAFTVPEKVNLGYTQISLSAQGDLAGLTGSTTKHSIQVQEFRRPEFEVKTRNESSDPVFAGDSAVLAVEASYYAGGPLPNAEVTWQVTSSPGQYSPPNWPEFIFGTWTPWWSIWEKPFGPGLDASQNVETFSGKTDASGVHYLRLDFDSSGGPQPLSVVAQATVMDVNRQAWTDTTTLLVHPADLYVGLRSQRYFVQRGDPLKVDFIVTDLDGNPIPDQAVEIQAARLDWKYRDGNWQEVETDVQDCQANSGHEPGVCTFETAIGGTYRISATVTDDLGRQNQSQITRWVSGGQMPPSRKVKQESLTLIPDQESYQPGDVAHILVMAPFSPAEGLLTVSRSGILYTQRFSLEDGSITLDVPIEEAFIPNLNIQVDINGSAPRLNDQGEPLPDTAPRPAFATGSLNLSIPPLQRSLSLEITPTRSELEPGGETTLDLVLKDAQGKPIPDAELAAVVVDEAILALSDYQLTDPLDVFYSDRPSYLMSIYGRAAIILANPLSLAENAAQDAALLQSKAGMREYMEAPAMAAQATLAPAAAGAPMGQAAPQPIRMRSDFNPLAVFAPQVRTDANGRAQVAVKVPDNLTRYRVMVVAVDQGNRFGMAESNLVARLPLMVRPSAPRFLNFGDQFELPVVLQNQTDEPMPVDVVVQASNLNLTGGNGMRVVVPARDRLEVRFPASAQLAGTARLQVAAVSGAYTDAATLELPVYTPATSEAFATYGVIDSGSVLQPVAAPQGVFPQYGGLEISTSSTALQALTDAVLYLVSYPFDCSEQIASRVLAVAALRDVLTAFDAQGLPSPAEMETTVQQDIQTLQGLQNSDGGFPYWRRGNDSIPFNTIHVAHALARASQKGFTIPSELQASVLEYLRQIESHYPSWYSQRTRWTLSAYALYVRNLMSDQDAAKAVKLIQEAGLENLSLDAVGWLWPVLQDDPNTGSQLQAIRQLVNNRVVETAGAANFTTDYDEQNYLLLGSNRRTDAILLDALIGDNPQSDLIPKVVNGLLAHRTRGRWGNTQENIFVLLSLDRYFNTYEAQTPDFVARLWLGDSYAGSSEFHGRTTERHETDVPMTYLVDPSLGGGATQDLVLSKEGDGRLYYRLGLRYAPSDLHLDPLDMGFAVQRVYEAVDNPEDVTRDSDGVWHIKAGARVRVRVTMAADNRRYHVALVDPLPAGLEIVNPDLAVSGSVPQDPNSPDYRYGWWWRWTWYEHQNLRDERAEAFTSLLWDGVYQYTYLARATTPGTFVVPPSKAEEMYSPEVFGRSASDLVIVK